MSRVSSAIGSANRSYTTVINQTAGVVGGAVWGGVPQSKVFGSTIGENAYFIDGMDATNPVMATATAASNVKRIRWTRSSTVVHLVPVRQLASLERVEPTPVSRLGQSVARKRAGDEQEEEQHCQLGGAQSKTLV